MQLMAEGGIAPKQDHRAMIRWNGRKKGVAGQNKDARTRRRGKIILRPNICIGSARRITNDKRGVSRDASAAESRMQSHNGESWWMRRGLFY